MPINASVIKSILFAFTDTWVFFFTVLGVILAISLLFRNTPPNQNNEWSDFALKAISVGGYFVGLGSALSLRFFRSYSIARRGRYILGTVVNNTVFGLPPRSSVRLNVRYTANNKPHLAHASVLGKTPEDGQEVLVAVDRDKPHRYRVVPYDFRLFRSTIQAKSKRLK